MSCGGEGRLAWEAWAPEPQGGTRRQVFKGVECLLGSEGRVTDMCVPEKAHRWEGGQKAAAAWLGH